MADEADEVFVDSIKPFIGRRGIVRRVFSRIGAERPQSVALIGGKKMGKTALLDNLFLEPVRNQYLDEDFVFAKLSCLGLGSPSELLSLLADQLPGDSGTKYYSYDDFRLRLEKSLGEGYKIIFLLDDFHLVTGNAAFPLEFFSFLRSLANNYSIAYVTSSLLELQQLCAAKDVEESPFFNIFTNFTLVPLDVQDTAKILTLLTGWESSNALSVAQWVGGIPYIIELVATAGEVEPPAQERLYPSTYSKILLDYFKDVVSMLSTESYEPLRRIAKQRAVAPARSYLVRHLVKQGFLKNTGKKLVPFSPAFSYFLKNDLIREMLCEDGNE